MHRLLLVALVGLFSLPVLASPTQPAPGAEYTILGDPQPVDTVGKRVEVIEFFMYHCPACYALEPQLQAWVKKQGNNITFHRIHVARNGDKDVEARMFLALQSMKLEDSMHDKVLKTWHVDHEMLTKDQDNIDWAIKNGIDKNRFIDVYYSFSVSSKLSNLGHTVENYMVTSTPTLVIGGRFLTGPGMLQQSNPTLPITDLDKAMLQVADVLVEQIKSGK